MPWAKTGGVWILTSGASSLREAVIAAKPLPADSAIRLQFPNPDQATETLLRADGMGRTAWSVRPFRGGTGSSASTIQVGAITGAYGGETITGGTSGATGVLEDVRTIDGDNYLRFRATGGTFASGETITGGTSGATSTAAADPARGVLEIRRVVHGVPQATDTGDWTPYALAGLVSGQPVVIESRVLASRLAVHVNDGADPILERSIASGQAIVNRYGFANTTSGVAGVEDARVTKAQVCELQANVQGRSDVGIWVAGGEVWAAVGDGSITRVASGVFRQTGQVSLAVDRQTVYGVDGQNAKKIDAVALEVSDWTATAGSLPGASDPGTTTARVVTAHRSRLLLAGMENDPQNVVGSAVGDPDDWDTAAEGTAGRAFALSGERCGRVGQPVVAMEPISSGGLMIGCTSQFWELVGDPALGQIDLVRTSKDTGASGLSSLYVMDDGLMLAHSPGGLYALGSGQVGARPMSRPTLSSLVTFPAGEREAYVPQVIRDPSRHVLLVFLTPVTSGPAVHLWLDQRVHAMTGRGWYPITFPDAIGPTCSVVYKGKVILGTRDGRLMTLSPDVTTDAGQAIEAKMPSQLLAPPHNQLDVIVDKLSLELSPDSDAVTWTWWGGRSAQQAYDADERHQLIQRTIAYRAPLRYERVRAPAVVGEISQSEGWFAVEAAYYAHSFGRRIRSWGVRAPAVPMAPCPFPGQPQPPSGSPVSASGSPFASGPGPGSPAASASGSGGGSVPPDPSGTYFSGSPSGSSPASGSGSGSDDPGVGFTGASSGGGGGSDAASETDPGTSLPTEQDWP